MGDRYPAAVQRDALLIFAEALSSASTAFRRDECGDPRINGSRGHVYSVPGVFLAGAEKTPGFLLYCQCESRKAWTYAKRALAFARVTQEGDDEGCLFMDRPPSTSGAETIRAYLGITKTREISDDHLAKLNSCSRCGRLFCSHRGRCLRPAPR
jgi:hypothetical protein